MQMDEFTEELSDRMKMDERTKIRKKTFVLVPFDKGGSESEQNQIGNTAHFSVQYITFIFSEDLCEK